MIYPRIAVTGANGFIGSYLISLIQKKGIKARGVVRSHNTSIAKSDFKFYPSRVKVDLLLM